MSGGGVRCGRHLVGGRALRKGKNFVASNKNGVVIALTVGLSGGSEQGSPV